MSSKILIADDSLTIQKVIGITLANSGYQLVESLKEEDLLTKIREEEFDLILLDFNLSDNKSGYDLSLEIKKAQPKAGLIIMLGTFDSVEESKFEECGINDKIVKPFESSKFIKKCKDVLENSSQITFVPKEKSETIKAHEDVHTSIEDNLDSWVVDAPKKAEPEILSYDEISLEESKALDPLSSEIQGWGFDSNSNLEEKYHKAFPPIIEEKNEDHHVIERLQSSSQFVDEVEASYDDDTTDPTFEVPQDLKRDLLSEIDMEVSAEAFWAVDEVVPVKSLDSDNIKDTHLDEVTADLTETVSQFKKLQEEPAVHLSHSNQAEEKAEKISADVDIDELVAKLKVALLPHLEKIVKDYCKETAEKVSWEVIPDLAENLIKKEIKNISDSIH